MNDLELLREYAANGSEQAFEALVRRYATDLEFTIKRGEGSAGQFVTKGHVSWVDVKQGLAVADLLGAWSQTPVHPGDQALF